METAKQIDNLLEVAKYLRQDDRLEDVCLEYPAYLSVVISEEDNKQIVFGYSMDYDEETDGLTMSWNDHEQGRAMEENGRVSFGDFATSYDNEQNAKTLITQLEQAGYLS